MMAVLVPSRSRRIRSPKFVNEAIGPYLCDHRAVTTGGAPSVARTCRVLHLSPLAGRGRRRRRRVRGTIRKPSIRKFPPPPHPPPPTGRRRAAQTPPHRLP